MNQPNNREIIAAARKFGWDLRWSDLTEDEQDKWDFKSEPGSDSDCPIYGVVALIGPSKEPCPLWFSSSDYRIFRSNTQAEETEDINS